MNLTPRQKQYIWIMGSFRSMVAVQGRGKRTPKLMYAVADEEQTVYIFGYSDPLYSLKHRGLVRCLQDNKSYVLTEEGEAVFNRLVYTQAGLTLNREIKEVQLKKETT